MTDDDLNLNPDPAPRDVVPRPGLTRETVLAFNEAAGKPVSVTEPGEVVEDVDGIPSHVGAPTETSAFLGRLTITRSQLADLGLTPEEVPNVRII